jgi:hypothetical protein
LRTGCYKARPSSAYCQFQREGDRQGETEIHFKLDNMGGLKVKGWERIHIHTIKRKRSDCTDVRKADFRERKAPGSKRDVTE